MLLDEIYERITWRTCLESLNSSAFLSILILGFLRHCYRGVSCLKTQRIVFVVTNTKWPWKVHSFKTKKHINKSFVFTTIFILRLSKMHVRSTCQWLHFIIPTHIAMSHKCFHGIVYLWTYLNIFFLGCIPCHSLGNNTTLPCV